MAYVIFDLDGTVIDSRHRHNTLPDGSLDLAHWMDHNHREMIMQDDLLPLARIMKTLAKTATIVVCTARAYQDADVEFLLKHGLVFDKYLSRGANIIHADGSYTLVDNRGDAQLKTELLNDYFISEGFQSVKSAKAIMFEDNLKVIDAMINIGVTCYDATICNRRLAA